MRNVLNNRSIKAFSVSLLFLVSSVSASVLMIPASASPNSAASMAPAPLSGAEANWAYTDGNQFAQDYNPQHQINSSNVQYLGIQWLYPLPAYPPALLSLYTAGGRIGVDTTPMIVNGTIYATTQEGQVIALNAANGNVIWTDVLPILPNSTSGAKISLSLHFHQGEITFTSSKNIFGGTPTYWIAAPDLKIYAINAINGKYEMNFSYYHGLNDVAGNSPTSTYAGLASNIVIDTQRGIAITSMTSSSNSNAARCFFRGWNILANPPPLLWTAYCSPPQPNSNAPLDPLWTIKQVNNMTGAQIFYPGPAYNGGGSIPATAVVDLKTLSPSVLNSTLYDDWGQSSQTAFCKAATAGMSTGAVGQGWGGSWVVDSRTGIAYLNTGNRGPYTGSCNPGPDLWASAIMALNDQTGQWIWGFQTSAHDMWDYDCSWYQGLGNTTVAGVSTEVLWKTCKNGYLFELNAASGKMVWAWTPPFTTLPRCSSCFMENPLNRTQMTLSWPAPNNANYIMNPSPQAGFESTATFNPATGYIYVVSHNVPRQVGYQPLNASNYARTSGVNTIGVNIGAYPENATVAAINTVTGQQVWKYDIPLTGFRGGLVSSGNVVFVPIVTGDLLMLNAQTGAVLKELFTGAPMDVTPAIGATSSGVMEVLLTVGANPYGQAAAVPGDLVTLTLQNVPVVNPLTPTTSASAARSTVTTTATTTVISTAGATSSGVDPTILYGVAAVAVILAISTGYLAMGRRKPAT